ncbi:hypothetical protein BpHYR1_003385 [Brachionus plicatilis]|uniref:Uncharacterized protein n=1 Tax=Brachionus plicatilis TaxID=10195 RepID=A0A3M7SYW6_BRAPC|nr:hypothetical protein BpHYR1_003385 [Brachionus plicatilis]
MAKTSLLSSSISTPIISSWSLSALSSIRFIILLVISVLIPSATPPPFLMLFFSSRLVLSFLKIFSIHGHDGQDVILDYLDITDIGFRNCWTKMTSRVFHVEFISVEINLSKTVATKMTRIDGKSKLLDINMLMQIRIKKRNFGNEIFTLV